MAAVKEFVDQNTIKLSVYLILAQVRVHFFRCLSLNLTFQ